MIELREQLQEDLRTVLEGLPEQAIDAACEAVVNRFNEYLKSS